MDLFSGMYAVPPQWIVEPEDVNVVAGEDFTLECHASGTPSTTVTWRRPQGNHVWNNIYQLQFS